MEQVSFLGKRVELVLSLVNPLARLRLGDQGIVTAQSRDGFNVPLQVQWDSGLRWSVHYDEIRCLEDRGDGRTAITGT